MNFSKILSGSIINTKHGHYYVLEQNAQNLYCLLMKKQVKSRNTIKFYIKDVGFVIFSDMITIPLRQVKNVELLISPKIEHNISKHYQAYINQRARLNDMPKDVIPSQHAEISRKNKKLIWHGRDGLPVYVRIVNGGRVSPK